VDDGNPCTLDGCDAAVGVTHVLDAGCGSRGAGAGGQTSTTPDPGTGGFSGTGGSGPVSDSCSSPSIHLVRVDDELDGLWRGVESWQTSRDVLMDHRFSLTFDRPVDPTKVFAAIELTGQVASILGGTASGDCRPGTAVCSDRDSGYWGNPVFSYDTYGVAPLFEWAPAKDATEYRIVYSADFSEVDSDPAWTWRKRVSGQRCGDLDRDDAPYENADDLCYVGAFVLGVDGNEGAPWGFNMWRVEAIVDGNEYWTSSRLYYFSGPTEPVVVDPPEDYESPTAEVTIEYECLHDGSIDITVESDDGEVHLEDEQAGGWMDSGTFLCTLILPENKSYTLTLQPHLLGVDWTPIEGDDDYIMGATYHFSVAKYAEDVDHDEDGWTIAQGDCSDILEEDENARQIHPGPVYDDQGCPDGDDWIDNFDENCNGEIDEDTPASDCSDDDGDGYTETDYHVDCDDTNPNVYPGAPEQCNGMDDNCNREIDEGIECVSCSDMPLDGGEEGIDSLNVDLGTSCGSATVTYMTYDIPDRVMISYAKGVVFDSGCVSTGNYPAVGVFDFCGDLRAVEVTVIGHCGEPSGYGDNNGSETRWAIDIPCGEIATR
jgi:hypothetical protein